MEESASGDPEIMEAFGEETPAGVEEGQKAAPAKEGEEVKVADPAAHRLGIIQKHQEELKKRAIYDYTKTGKLPAAAAWNKFGHSLAKDCPPFKAY